MRLYTEPSSAAPRLLSVGHSNLTGEAFLSLLKQAGITAIADVRSQPYSRRHPHFCRPELEQALRERGIVYVFLGDQLGGRPDEPELYDADGRVNYEAVRLTDRFRDGLDRLQKAVERFTVAMLCAEEDPLDCHRGLMIAPALAERGVLPGHLRGDGKIEPARDMEDRLLDLTGVGSGLVDGLFAAEVTDEDRRELLAEAYRRWARKKGYRAMPGTSEPEA